MNTEDDVDAIVRERLKPIRESRKRALEEVTRLKAEVTRLKRELDRASRAEGRELERATVGTGEMGQ